MTLEVRQEAEPDYAETGALAAAAFDLPTHAFRPERLRWLYLHAFHHGSTIFGLFDGAQKVGQVVLVHQRVRVDGDVAAAVALFDLFISKAHRSRAAIGLLYGAVETFCRAERIRFVIGVPNAAGARVNIRHLGLAAVGRLDLRAGLAARFALPRSSKRILHARRVTELERAEGLALFARYLPPSGNGIDWSAESLWARLSGGFADYATHATSRLLLVSAPRVTRGVKHTLLCGFFTRDATADRRDVAALTADACRLQRRFLYVYAGCHNGMPLPGLRLPDALRPSPLAVQMRDFDRPDETMRLDRFELLDFDFA